MSTRAKDAELAELKKKVAPREFGGVPGTTLLTFLLPAIIYWVWASIEHNRGYLLAPTSYTWAGLRAFGATFGRIIYQHAFPTQKAALIYFAWFLFQAFLQAVVPGRVVEGAVLPGGHRLKYTLNGWASWWITMAAVGVAHYFFDLPLTILYDNYGPMLSVVIIWSFVLSALLAVHATVTDSKERMSGWFPYDFWMGFARNPRIGSFDLKLFCEARPGLILWVLMNFSVAAKQYERFGEVTLSTGLVCAFHFLYVMDYYFHEENILSTMDIITEKFGFMLVFGDLAWVPFTYSFQTLYLLRHTSGGHLVHISYTHATIVIVLFGIGYFFFRMVNSQKHAFRRNPEALIWGEKPKFINTKRGTKLLTSGYWGLARHLNYTGDILIGWSWCLPCGFDSIVPYFYGIYFTALDLHRCYRDHRECKHKYGEDWDTYCKKVPYVFIPKVI